MNSMKQKVAKKIPIHKTVFILNAIEFTSYVGSGQQANFLIIRYPDPGVFDFP